MNTVQRIETYTFGAADMVRNDFLAMLAGTLQIDHAVAEDVTTLLEKKGCSGRSFVVVDDERFGEDDAALRLSNQLNIALRSARTLLAELKASQKYEVSRTLDNVHGYILRALQEMA
jgi:hypothetical protein